MNVMATSKRFFSVFLLHTVLLIPQLSHAGAYQHNPTAPEKTFRQALKLSVVKLKGGAANIIEDEEQCIRLSSQGWAEVAPPMGMTGDGGTLSFKIKPLWNTTNESHPLLSMRWGDAKGGYLVVSHGWWEPTGNHRFYFVFNNEEFAHCSAPCELSPGEWSEVTVTWRSGRDGYCRLYINGDRIAETRFSNKGNYLPKGPLFIGTDRGTSLSGGRRTNAVFTGLMAWNTALTDREVDLFFAGRFGGEERAKEKKATWNKWLLEQKTLYEPVRDNRGMLRESRVMFDEDMEWATSRAATDRIIASIKRAGFNVYIPCVWYGGNTLYPTTLAPMLPALVRARSKASDPLAYLIEQAHLNGIEIHPWFQVVRRSETSFPEFAGDGVPNGAYDVHNPQFRTFIVELMSDVVRRYQVDGINLDYIRSVGNCTRTSCRADYRRLSGRDLLVDIGASGSQKDAAVHLREWNNRAVGKIVSDFVEKARALRPGLIISVDSSLLSDFFLSQGNDAINWVNAGLIDVVFHMDYARCPDWKTALKARDQFDDGNRMVMLLADFTSLDHGVVPYDGKLLADYVRIVRKNNAHSIAFYHRPQLSEQQATVLADSVFREPAHPLWPNSPWKKAQQSPH